MRMVADGIMLNKKSKMKRIINLGNKYDKNNTITISSAR